MTTLSPLPRHDLYRAIHKALRHCMAQAMWQLGRLDLDDDDECGRVLDAIEAMLAALRSHLQHENEVLHTAIEARRPGATLPVGEEHHERLEALCDLADEVQALRAAAPARRSDAAERLYRHLAGFVGRSLQHMQAEECSHNTLLWALYDDAELRTLQNELLVRIGPAAMLQSLRWMAASLSVAELAELLRGMAAQFAPEDTRAMLELARESLSEARWARLAHAVGVAPVPGLMTA